MRTYSLRKQSYKVVSIHKVGIANATGVCCENCGSILVNHATIKDPSGKNFIVGLDCLKTFTKANDILNKDEAEIELYSFKKVVKFIDTFKKNKPLSYSKDIAALYFDYKNAKGKSVYEMEWINNFKKFNIELPF